MDKMPNYTEEELLELNIDCKSIELVNLFDLVINPTVSVGDGSPAQNKAAELKPSPQSANDISYNPSMRNERFAWDRRGMDQIKPVCKNLNFCNKTTMVESLSATLADEVDDTRFDNDDYGDDYGDDSDDEYDYDDDDDYDYVDDDDNDYEYDDDDTDDVTDDDTDDVTDDVTDNVTIDVTNDVTDDDNTAEKICMQTYGDRLDLMRSFMFGERVENNNVLRIFQQLHSLHHYLNDDYPSLQRNNVPSNYAFEWSHRSTIPGTLNIKYHIQYVIGKLMRFIGKMKRLLDSNKHFDYMKYTECVGSLGMLEVMTFELSKVRNVEMLHFDFVFTTYEATKLSKYLEYILARISDQVRECHLYIIVFNWEMDQEHRQSRKMIAERQKTLDFALQLVFDDKNNEVLEFAKRKLTSINLPERYELTDVVAAASYFNEMLEQMLNSPEQFAESYMINLQLRQQARANIDHDLATNEEAEAVAQPQCNEWYNVADFILQELLFVPIQSPKQNEHTRKSSNRFS